jgi:hypothetical protein
MSGPGYVFKDSGLTPEPLERTDPINYNEIANTNQDMHTRRGELAQEAHLLRTPTNETAQSSTDDSGRLSQIIKEFTPDSHDIVERAPNSNGAIRPSDQHNEGALPRDIGWHKPSASIPDPLLEGVPNGKLFARIRRFNKVSRSAFNA